RAADRIAAVAAGGDRRAIVRVVTDVAAPLVEICDQRGVGNIELRRAPLDGVPVHADLLGRTADLRDAGVVEVTADQVALDGRPGATRCPGDAYAVALRRDGVVQYLVGAAGHRHVHAYRCASAGTVHVTVRDARWGERLERRLHAEGDEAGVADAEPVGARAQIRLQHLGDPPRTE